MTSQITSAAIAAKAASRHLSLLDQQTKNDALERMATALETSSAELMAQNRRDVEDANASVAAGALSAAALARLALSPEKIRQMSAGVRAVKALEDPVGRVLLHSVLDEGLDLKKVTCPFGVIAAIVEARPDAVVQLSALALKSGNTLLIKAGAEVSRTASAIVALLSQAAASVGEVPASTFTHVEGREAARELLGLHEYVDLVVPRGSAELVRFVSSNTRIPVLGHADGVCHIYIDAAANRDMAIALILDSKTQAPSTCNAVETVLVDAAIAGDFLPVLVDALHTQKVKTRGCEMTRSVCRRQVEAVAEHEWHLEYGDLTLAIRVVNGLDGALEHIERFGSHHTDCIVTDDHSAAERFLREVDSAGVFHNVSTRFSDGYRYGFGAEVGISTGKLHARGPVGLEGLVTYKYILSGTGQCVSQYSGPGARRFRHEMNFS